MSSLFTLRENRYLYLRSRSNSLMKIEMGGFIVTKIVCDLNAEEGPLTVLTLERDGYSHCRVLQSNEDKQPHSWFMFSCPGRTENCVLCIQSNMIISSQYYYKHYQEKSELIMEVYGLPQTYDDTIAKILRE